MIDTTTLLFRTVVLYFALSVFFYPYGFPLLGTAFFRFGDFVALLAFGVTALLVLIYGRMRGTIIAFWPILPLFMAELLMPIIGAVVFGTLDGIANAFRIITLHGMVLIVACFANTRRLEELLQPLIIVLRVGLLTNMIYASVQVAVGAEILPESLLITRHLEIFSDGTVRENFFRPSGFFRRPTDLGEIGVIGLAFFAARFKYSNHWGDLLSAGIGIILVLLSTSRASTFAVAVILLLFFGSYLVHFNLRTLFKVGMVLLLIAVLSSVFVWWLGSVVDTERYFARVVRLASPEVLEDRSLLTRTQRRWPYILRQVEGKYPYGTLLNPHDVFGPIDSGFLAYYAQGRWLGLVIVMWLFGSLFYLTIIKRYKRAGWTRLFLLYLAVYAGAGMIVQLTIQAPLVVFWLYISLWLLYAEEQGYLSPLTGNHPLLREGRKVAQ